MKIRNIRNQKDKNEINLENAICKLISRAYWEKFKNPPHHQPPLGFLINQLSNDEKILIRDLTSDILNSIRTFDLRLIT